MSNADDFVSTYMRMCDPHHSEAPAIYHRWCALSIMGALMGRQIWINFGIGPIYPNQYIMLMGEPGTRKGSAYGIAKQLLKQAGYSRFAKDKTSKERFLVDMKSMDSGPDTILSVEDLEEMVMDAPAETYIMSGEFTDFIGQGNMEFVTFLTNVWDNLPLYEHPKLHGKSVIVHKPTVNLLGCNTTEGFSLAFPPESLGNGFLSRVIMVHADPTGVRIAWPEGRDELMMADLSNRMIAVRKEMHGEMKISDEARKVSSKIYADEIPVDDPRFKHYQQRRYIHMLKISMLLAAFELEDTIQAEHIIRANTVLALTEKDMSKALGEFGASKYSTVAGKILSYLNTSHTPQSNMQIWKVVARDLNKMGELIDILSSLKAAEKIQVKEISGKAGYLPLHRQKKEWPTSLLDLNWLTDLEHF